MIQKKYFLTTVIAILSFSSSMHAQNIPIQFKDVKVIGSGCPQDQTSITVSPSQGEVSLILGAMNLQVPTIDQKFIDHRVCDVSFKAVIPEGYQVRALALKIDQRGFLDLTAGVRASAILNLIRSAGLFQRQGIPNVQKALHQQSWGRDQRSVSEELFWSIDQEIPLPSRCAARGDQQIDLSLKHIIQMQIPGNLARNPRSNASGVMMLDSVDLSGRVTKGLKLGLRVMRCQMQRPGEREDRRRERQSPGRGQRRLPGRTR